MTLDTIDELMANATRLLGHEHMKQLEHQVTITDDEEAPVKAAKAAAMNSLNKGTAPDAKANPQPLFGILKRDSGYGTR